MDKKQATAIIKSKAHELGFMFCGVSRAQKLETEARRLEDWLNKNRNGEMQWMENHFEKRIDPTKLVPGSKSVVSVAMNYFNGQNRQPADSPKISKYAYGRDYHKVLKKRLKQLFQFINEEIGEVEGRFFVDSAPVMDKAWAKRSGLGWQGKNTNLISPKVGSFFFLGELIIDLELEYDGEIKDFCGSCTRCLDVCPTGALNPDRPYEIEANRCISYYTIELKGSLPDGLNDQFENWMFGCDICQDVCPWNRKSIPHDEPDFNPKSDLLQMTAADWQNLTKDVFDDIFAGSPVKRTGFDGLKRNIQYVAESTGARSDFKNS